MKNSILRFQHAAQERADLAATAREMFTAAPQDVRTGASDGWFGVGISEAAGGSGGDLGDVAVIAEEAGASCAASAFSWTTGIVGGALSNTSSTVIKSLAGGDRLLSVPVSGASPNRNVSDSGSGKISAEVLALGSTDASLALPHRIDLSEALIIVPRDHPAVEVTAVDGMDESRPWSRYVISSLDLADADVVVADGIFERWASRFGLLFAIDAVGTARAALESTIEYATVREQFGRPLGSFQAYKHLCATSLVDLKLAQSVSHRAAADVTDTVNTAAAVTEATGAAARICSRAIQLHGGVGFSAESGVHRYLRRARANEILANSTGPLRALLATVEGSRG